MSEAHARAWWEDVQHLREAAEQRIAERERAQREGRLRPRADRSPSAVTSSPAAATSSSARRAASSARVAASPVAIAHSRSAAAGSPKAVAASAATAAATATATALAIDLEPELDPELDPFAERHRDEHRGRFEREAAATRTGRFDRQTDVDRGSRRGRSTGARVDDRASDQRERPSRREELSRLAREQARAATAPRPRAGSDQAAATARRTIEIRGQVAQRPAIAAVPDPVDPALAVARRRSRPGPSPAERFAARPDRVAQWAFLLGLFLIFVAAVSAHG